MEIHSKGSTMANRFLGKDDWYYKKTSQKKLLEKLNEVSLRTILSKVEEVINDRPLTYMAFRINNPTPITPSLLLNGRRTTP